MTHIPARASRTQEYDPDYDTRMPRSAIRYPVTQPYVIQRGNKRIVFHTEPPPRRSPHWLLFTELGMIVALLLWLAIQNAGTWWNNHQMDSTYGFPRTYQVDAIVYPGDSDIHPSHYIFLNLNGAVLIIEFPHGDSSHARIYKGPVLFSDNANQIPVTGEFREVSGREEMLVHIEDRVIVYVSNGTQFISQ